jgi:hypothetical protein
MGHQLETFDSTLILKLRLPNYLVNLIFGL